MPAPSNAQHASNKYDVIIATERQFECLREVAKLWAAHIRAVIFMRNVLREQHRKKENTERRTKPQRNELLKGYLSCFNVTKETTYVLNSLNLAIYAHRAYLNVLNGECGTF